MDELELLKAIADDADEFSVENGEIYFQRHGKEYIVIVKRMPNAGIIVESCNGDNVNKTVLEFIQSYLLDLPTLASQISRTLEAKREKMALRYIDAPAIIATRSGEFKTKESKNALLDLLKEPVAFITQIIHLMATAGQGKTFLLDELAIQLAQTYSVNTNPTPILLPIDLLGRYIGTIDDAIAGSLNNTYNFPRLSQKDVILCLRLNWVCLALDGFDELVARIGSSEAFSKITDLLDQLKSNGSIILSARENFFESHNIIYSMQSFLRPQVGSYETTTVSLVAWEQEQIEKIFGIYGSRKANDDYLSLKEAFGNDVALLANPFFVTKICKLWFEKQERFYDLDKIDSQLSRINYIIEIYIKRETQEKWVTREGNEIISYEDHNFILGYIAEEMWRTSSFKLSIEELKLATEIACTNKKLSPDKIDATTERIQTHAVLDASNKLYSFSHDQFFNFYFGYRVAFRIIEQDFSEIETIFSEREINPLLSSWIKYNITKFEEITNNIDVINMLQEISSKPNVSLFLKNNIGFILSALISLNSSQEIEIKNCVFSSDSFKKANIKNISFKNCDFWRIDLSDSTLCNCSFTDCSFSDLKINEASRFKDVVFWGDFTITQLSVFENNSDGKLFFSPVEIKNKLSQKDIKFKVAFDKNTEDTIEVRDDILNCIIKFIKKSNKFYNISINEMVEEVSRFSRDIGKIGLETGIFKEKYISGTNQDIVIFACDKNSLLKALNKKVTDKRINDFWDRIVAKYPAKKKFKSK